MKSTNNNPILPTDQDEYGRIQGKERRGKKVRGEKHVNKSSESIVTWSCIRRVKRKQNRSSLECPEKTHSNKVAGKSLRTRVFLLILF